MALISSPYGFRPIYHPSGQIRSMAYPNMLLAGAATNPIYKYQPVNLAIGTGAAINGITVAANQVAMAPVVLNSVNILGVFAGVEYTDINGRRQVSDFWPAGSTGFTQIIPYVWDDPATIFQVQADATFNTSLAPQGREAPISNFTAGSTTTGLSACTLSASGLAAQGAQSQWRVVQTSYDIADASLGDPFPDLWVMHARHQYLANFVSI